MDEPTRARFDALRPLVGDEQVDRALAWATTAVQVVGSVFGPAVYRTTAVRLERGATIDAEWRWSSPSPPDPAEVARSLREALEGKGTTDQPARRRCTVPRSLGPCEPHPPAPEPTPSSRAVLACILGLASGSLGRRR